MQLVIEIPDMIYEQFGKEYRELSISQYTTDIILDAFCNGTILPKRHGRLIDADELKKEYPHDTDWDYPVNTNCYVVESIDNSLTIIEAESEG